MKTRLIFAALLLLAFGSVKAQVNMVTVSKNADTIIVITPDRAEFDRLMREYNANLQNMYDSIDWKRINEEVRRANRELQRAYDSIDWDQFERNMEKWAGEMEKWGRKVEKWGERIEQKFGGQFNYESPRSGNAQVHAIQMTGSGVVSIRQSLDKFALSRNHEYISDYRVVDGMLMLSGSGDYEVSLLQLDEICMNGSGDVIGRGTLKGRNLDIEVWGSGDLWLNVDYDTIRVRMSGSGDVTLKGQCKVIFAEISGSGDLQIPQLHYEKSQINASGTGEVWTNGSREVISQKYNWERRKSERSLLFNPRWNGFEAGLNMLFSLPVDAANTNNSAQALAIRSLRCWYFGFNIADVGIAFNRKHTAGVFTGIGIGWNNFSWSNDITVEYDPDNVVYTVVPIDTDQIVKNSKYGALFLQVPLMVEVRPTRRMYIDAGVTGGLRITQWNRVKLADGSQYKRYSTANLDMFKLDASLRVGGRTFGFFANYALLPLFEMSDAKVHPLSFGLSINF